MKNCFFTKKLIYYVLASTIFVSCIKKGAFDFSNSSLKLDGTWGIALINDEVSFTDFTLDSALNILSDGNIIKVIYNEPMKTSGKVEDLFSVVDYQWHFSMPDIVEPPSPPITETIIFSTNQDILFYGDTNQALIDTAVFNGGTFQLALNNPISHAITLRVKSRYFHYPNGGILDTVVTIPSNATHFSIGIDLTGCRVRLKRNSLPCEISVAISDDGLPFVGGKKTIEVDVFGTFYVFKLLQGKVIAHTERLRYESDFDIDNNGKMSFLVQNIKGAQIRINSYNSFGAGVAFTVDTCDIITNGVSASLLSTNSTFAFEPAFAYYTTKTQSITLPFQDFSIANKNRFRFAGTALANELGMNGPDIWALDHSSFSIEPSLELPLDFNLDHFIYRDTIAQEIAKIESIDLDGSLTFRIELLNDFPIELGAQFYFLDDNFRVIDSLFSNGMLIGAARTNSTDGKTIVSGKMNPNPLFVEVSNNRLEKIYHTKYIFVQAKATSGNQQAKIRPDQKLKIKLGVKATLKMQIKK